MARDGSDGRDGRRHLGLKKLGIYAEGKYIHSRGELIDFNEAALLIGISLSLRL